MKKIGDITNTADKNGEFTDGNVAAGTPPTQLMAAWFNSVQREILNVLEQAGIPQSKTKENQLAEAVIELIKIADYATNQDLDKKFDKIGGVLNGGIQATGIIQTTSGQVTAYIPSGFGVKLDATGDAPSLGARTKSGGWSKHTLQTKDGVLMHCGDFGWGGIGNDVSMSESQISSLLKNNTTVSQIYRNTTNSTKYSKQWSTCAYFRSGGTWLHISSAYTSGDVIISSGDSNNDFVANLYSNLNTAVDRNGYIKTSSSAEVMQSVPIGGSILWNTSAPIPNNFWANEGRSFSASEYPEAAKVMPSLKLPDDRGYAIRIADNGRGIDTGRQVATYQEDAMRDITGELGWEANGLFTVANGVFTGIPSTTNSSAGSGENRKSISRARLDVSNVVPTANEFRMKNVSKILITRMK